MLRGSITPVVGFTSALLSLALLQAQTTLQFLAFPKKLKPEPIELVVGDNQTIEIEIPGNELSPSYKVPSLESIVVGKKGLDEEGEPTFDVFGKGKSLGLSKQIILLLRKGQEDRDGFVVLPVSGELGDFSGGSYLFINASSLNVGGVIGDSKFALKPGQRRMLQPKPNFDGDVCQVTLSYQLENQWKVFKDTRWSGNKAYRTLVFFYKDEKTGRLGVSPITDILPYETGRSD